MIMLINIFTKYIYWLFWQGETLWFYILDKEGLRRQSYFARLNLT